MPQDHRRSKTEVPLVEAPRLGEQGYSCRRVADAIGWSMPQTRRYLLGEIQTNGEPLGEPITTLPRVEIVGEPVSADTISVPVQRTRDLTDMAAQVASLEAHRVEVEIWLATFQAQSRETAQPYATPTHIWNDPDDAKSVPCNLSLPRGRKYLLNAEAKRTGFPAGRLVQWLLTASLVGQEVGGDA
jgi:hypothetical protein